jgi:hypothetical protein
MMTVAAFADSLLPGNSSVPRPLEMFGEWLDVSLTSSIAVSMMFNGLADVRLVNPDSTRTKIAQALFYVSVFAGYAYNIFYDPTSYIGVYIYEYLTIFTCGLYVVSELVYIVFQRHFAGVQYLFIAGVSGAAGLYGMIHYPPWLCVLLTPIFGMSEMWFFLSDLAMLCIFGFYCRNHAPQSLDSEKNTEMRSYPASLNNEEEESLPLEPLYKKPEGRSNSS